MGMFDYLIYKEKEYQTKDTPNQALDYYEIRGDELWVEKYDSDWIDEPGLMFGGYLERKNKRWEFFPEFDGVIIFYRSLKNSAQSDWEEYKALFKDGRLIKIEEL